MKDRLGDVVAMTEHSWGSCQCRGSQAASARHRRAAAVLAVACEAALGVRGGAALDRRSFVRWEVRAPASGRRRGQDALRNPHRPLALARIARGRDGIGRAGHFQVVEGQHRLNHDVGVAIVRRDGAEVGGERHVTGLVQRFAHPKSLYPHGGIRVVEYFAHEGGVEAAESFESPQRVKPRELVLRRADEGLQRRRHGLVLLQHQQLLRGVAPPPVRVRQVLNELVAVSCSIRGFVRSGAIPS